MSKCKHTMAYITSFEDRHNNVEEYCYKCVTCGTLVDENNYDSNNRIKVRKVASPYLSKKEVAKRLLKSRRNTVISNVEQAEVLLNILSRMNVLKTRD
jgi:DNA-directed RNA polymerase subunit RPC12/RpoP